MLDLVRLSSRRLFPPGGEDLYRQVARLTEMGPGTEVLDVASGRGVPLEYFAREYAVHGTGVDADARLVAEAEAHARAKGLGGELNFQQAESDDLPFRDETFDVVVGEVGLAAWVDPRAAIKELARVTRPGGQVVLIQLVWKAPVDRERRRVLSEHLGARPLMMVEVRQVLLEAGVGELVTEDWTDGKTAFRGEVKKPFPDFSELFSVKEKLAILRRAWVRWGWRGVLTVFRREAEVHRLLTRERLLGLNLLKGTKAAGGESEEPVPLLDRQPLEEAPDSPPGAPGEDGKGEGGSSGLEEPFGEGERDGGGHDGDREGPGDGREDGDLQTTGLPLFGDPARE